MDHNKTEYLGDGLYASYDGFQIRLFTERDHGQIHEVYLDPYTLMALQNYFMKIKRSVNDK